MRFPGNRNIKCMTKKLQNVTAFVVQKFCWDPSLVRNCRAQTVRMPKFMHRQAHDWMISMKNGQNIARRRKLALRLLDEGKRSLRDIARITNFDKSTPSRIGKCLCSNDYVTLEKMLCPSTYKRCASAVSPSEEEAILTERHIYAGKRRFAVGKDTFKSLMSQIASDGRPSWKDGEPSEDAIGHSRPDIEKSYSKMPRKITYLNFGSGTSMKQVYCVSLEKEPEDLALHTLIMVGLLPHLWIPSD